MKGVLKYFLLKDIAFSNASSKYVVFCALLTAFSICLCVTGFLYMLPNKHVVYYGACGLSLGYILFKGGIKINLRFLFFYLIIFFNVAFLDINPMFKSTERACAFLFVTLVCSPAIDSSTAVAYRERVFRYVLVGLSILTILSFFCFFLGVNMMPYNREASVEAYLDYQNNGGKFSGLFNHSMIFGPIAAIVSLAYLNLYLENSKKTYLALFFVAFTACLFSAARSALLAIFLGVLMLVLKEVLRKSLKNIKKLFYLFVFVSFALLPISDVAFSGVLNKMETTQEQFDGYNSRDKKYEYRIREFQSSPVLGVGFASVSTEIGDGYNPLNGQIEPGTAHLAVLAQTGILGVIVYVLILYGAYRMFRGRDSLKSNICLTFFWAFFAHGWAEGWVFAPGGMICFLFWLSISQCYDLKWAELRVSKYKEGRRRI